MTDSHLNLDKISEKVLEVLEQFDIHPISYGVAIALKKEEFERISDQHPDHNHPGLILKTRSESNGLQWYVQILKEMSFDDLSPAE